jgi:hypothetical protein
MTDWQLFDVRLEVWLSSGDTQRRNATSCIVQHVPYLLATTGGRGQSFLVSLTEQIWHWHAANSRQHELQIGQARTVGQVLHWRAGDIR